MSRLGFILFGGDLSDPAIRRMVWRVSVAAFFFGMGLGALDVFGAPEPLTTGRLVIAGFCLVCFAAAGYEMRRYYLHADEMLRNLLSRSFSAAFAAVLVIGVLYGFAEVLLGAPRLSMIAVTGVAAVFSSIAWLFAAMRNT